jgi:glucose-1-phosphate thymidylyltransferase
VFLKEVPDPVRFGVAEIGPTNYKLHTPNSASILSIKEKPKSPKSNLAVTGCYVYDKHCFEHIRSLKPSARGELEITDLSKRYLEQGKLTATILKDEWIDAGTFESLYRAATIVRERSN